MSHPMDDYDDEHLKKAIEERRTWTDQQILDELRSLPVLADEDYLMDSQDPEVVERWYELERFLALRDIAEERKLRDAIPLLIECASFGDPGETMRGLPNRLLRIADTDEHALQGALIEASRSLNKGARYWATFTLSYFASPTLVPVMVERLNDPNEEIANEAVKVLGSRVKVVQSW